MEGLYNLYQVLVMEKKSNEAYPYLMKAYELNPDDSDISLGLAYYYYQKQQYSRAREILNHLLSVDPNNTGAKRMLEQAKRGM